MFRSAINEDRPAVTGVRITPANPVQVASAVMMVRPARFEFNTQTAVNNAFQKNHPVTPLQAQQKALEEFDRFAGLLKEAGIPVTVIQDTYAPHTPDSIFPNNWISFHDNGIMAIYPLFAQNRRWERDPGIIQYFRDHFRVKDVYDFTHLEEENFFLEGTGSMVLDRVHRIAYACHSPRTNEFAIRVFCRHMGYTPIMFNALDTNGQPFYHTNVMMSLGSSLAILCLDSIPMPEEREYVVSTLQKTGKEILPVTQVQVNEFAGNMLQLRNAAGECFWVLSQRALRSLTPVQQKRLEAGARLIVSDISCIEELGGGSVRCMLAENFLPAFSS